MVKTAKIPHKDQVATEALELQRQVDKLLGELEAKKDELREIANGNKLEIVIEGLGKINVSTPREGSEKVILTVNEERLSKSPELKAKLIEAGVAKEELKKVAPARASVTIKPNV